MWQPPAFSPLTRYFYTMAINEPHIYKVKPLKPWVPGTPEVGQQFGNAPPPRRSARLGIPDDPAFGNISAIDVDTARSPGSIRAIT
jgi:hypothetical protein